MSSDLRTIQASCSCGNARHSISFAKEAYPLGVTICHCNSCRHGTGLLGPTTASLPKGYQADQTLLNKLTLFDYSKNVQLFFCPQCGTKILAYAKSYDHWEIFIGTLEESDSSVVKIRAHLHLEDTLDGGLSDILNTVDGSPIKRYSKGYGSEELPLYWTASGRPPVRSLEPDERLPGYCKCRGVEFWLTAPSARSMHAQQAYKNGVISSDSSSPADKIDSWWLRDNDTRFRAAICPCDSCRLVANGNAFAQWAYLPTVDLSLDSLGKIPIPKSLKWGTIKHWQTRNATQAFCGKCGAVIFWSTAARPYLQDYGVGLFESPDGARAESWFRWRTAELRYREDGMSRAPQLTLAIEEGLAEYKRNVQNKVPGHDRDAAEGHR